MVRNKLVFFALLILGNTALHPRAASAQVTLITHARIFDGTAMLGARDVLVRDGKIAAIGPRLKAPAGANVVDGTGKTLLPGLIDSHTHAFGSALADALAFGVTTELDMFTDPGEASARRAEQAKGNVADRADLYSAGVLVTAPGGHGTEYGMSIPTLASPDSAQSFVDARIKEGSDYIKIILDDGSAYGRKIPTVSPAVLRAVVKAAHVRRKLAVVHVGTLANAHAAIDAGADGLVHLFIDRQPGPGFGKLVAAHKAFVVPTLTVLQSVTGDANLKAFAADPRLAPYLGVMGRGTLLAKFPFNAKMLYAAAEESVRQLAAAHVPILAGTDATNPGTAHGISIHREMELLVKAGLTPTAALVAATSAPARAFSLADRGSIAVGRRADLLLVEGDPTKDITATRTISAIWKGGVLVNRAAIARTIATANARPAMPTLGLVSNFEDGKPSATYGMGWVNTSDAMAGGSSKVEVTVGDGGANGSAKALTVTGSVAPGLPYAWAGAMFMPSTQPMAATDISKAKEIRFWAQGDGATYQVMVFAESKGRTPLTVPFVANAEWKEFVFPLSSFAGFDGHDLQAIAITAGPKPGVFRLRVDEVRIQ